MKLKVLASSSRGNCYLIENKTECLVLEAGIPFKEVKRELNFKINKIVGVLISHEHGDHLGYAKDYASTGIFIYASAGTLENVTHKGINKRMVKAGEILPIGNFKVISFTTKHDAKEPLGFLIYHKDMGSLVFATDTYYIENTFPNVNHILVECNYSHSILDNSNLHEHLKARIIKSHFSLENVKEFLEVNNSNSLKNVVLLHLSDGNSDEEKFKRECEIVTNKPTYIAGPGLEIDLKLVPF